MSEIRLVRCPKCSKVLPEPSQYAVYQCGGCSAILRAKKSTIEGGISLGSGEEKLVNSSGMISEEERESEETVELREGPNMGSRSPSRTAIGDGNGSKSSLRESGLTEFDGGLPKSPMRERFLSDLGSVPNSPVRSRNVSRSPVRERGHSGDFDVNGVDQSPASSRDVSKSPMSERVSKTPVSVRSRDVSRSPMREKGISGDLSGVNKSPARSINGDIPRSPMKRDGVSELDHFGIEEEVRSETMAQKASFNAWLPEENHSGQSNDMYSVRKRRTWRDRVAERDDLICEERESVYYDEHGVTSEGVIDDLFRGIDPRNERIHNNLRFKGDYVGGYARSRGTIDQRVTERGRISVSSSTSDGPSSYHLESNYGYNNNPRHNFASSRGPANMQDLKLERAQLLRKYMELKDQLSDLNGYSGPDGFLEEESLRFRQGSMQQFAPDKSFQRPPYLNPNPGPVHNMVDMYDVHPALYDDPFSGQMARVPHHKHPHQFSKHPIPSYVPRQLDFDQDPHGVYLDETTYHHSAKLAANRRTTRSMNLERHVPRAYNPRMAHSSLLEQPIHLDHRYPRRVPVNKRLCHPIAGGSPFVLCHNCFRLLKLPRKLIAIQKNQYQLKCGACSAVTSFDLQNRSFGPFASQKTAEDSVDMASSGFSEVLKESVPKHRRDSFAATSTNIGSYDFDAVGYSFQSVDPEPYGVSKGSNSSSNLAENVHRLSLSSSRSARSSQSNLPRIMEMPSEVNHVRPPPGSPLQDHLDYSSKFRRSEAGDITSYTREEKRVLQNDASLESSMGSTGATSLSEDSEDVSRGEDRVGNNKGRQSQAAIRKWGFILKPGHGSPGRAEVYVNGQPIPHRVVKRAEKFAGEIQPGEYWYDSKAGFWGVMGHRCLGIIPPFIQEFSFPMPANCSGGDTFVFVNGRELHKRDMGLLTSRGLPITRDKSYIVDISGKVLDGETREFIVNLGKLAPTIEKRKCGFGMQVPKQLDD